MGARFITVNERKWIIVFLLLHLKPQSRFRSRQISLLLEVMQMTNRYWWRIVGLRWVLNRLPSTQCVWSTIRAPSKERDSRAVKVSKRWKNVTVWTISKVCKKLSYEDWWSVEAMAMVPTFDWSDHNSETKVFKIAAAYCNFGITSMNPVLDCGSFCRPICLRRICLQHLCWFEFLVAEFGPQNERKSKYQFMKDAGEDNDNVIDDLQRMCVIIAAICGFIVLARKSPCSQSRQVCHTLCAVEAHSRCFGCCKPRTAFVE